MKKGVFLIFVFFILLNISVVYAVSCIDTDGENYYNKGSVSGSDYGGQNYGPLYDYCEGNIIKEYYCKLYQEFGGNYYYKDIKSFTCPSGCSNGACKSGCTDTDSSQNSFIQGSVSGIRDDGTSFGPLTDSCIGGGVHEYYCEPSTANNYYYTWIACDHGCSSGACEGWCEDDGYKDYYHKQSITGRLSNGFPFTFPDTCASGSVLTEFYCVGINPLAESYTCPAQYGGTCSDGACSSTPIPTPICTPNTYACVNGNVYLCNSQGTGQTLTQNCVNGCANGICNLVPSDCTSGNGCVTGCTPIDPDCTCAAQSGDICTATEICTGTSLTHSDAGICCSIACTTPPVNPPAPQDCINTICPDHNTDSSSKEQNCRGEYIISGCNCYWSSAGTCKSCSPSTSCIDLGTQDDCEQSCNLNCVWNSNLNTCENPVCVAGNSDLDSICDGDDNCIDVANSDQANCDGDLIGDVCDADCYGKSGCDNSLCPNGCIDNDPQGGDGVCDDYYDDQTHTCDEQQGAICSSGLDCIGGYSIVSSDSSSGRCCLLGSCGIVSVSLSGETQIRVEESECINPNDDGIGKKLVYKYNQADQLMELPHEEDCAILPSATVPFYSSISIIITALVLISFYVFRSKIFSYFRKK